jgi:hypothetical protein
MKTSLNEKLAKWAGFQRIDAPQDVLRRGHIEGYWEAPISGRGKRFYYVPDFTTSLDECFNWLAFIMYDVSIGWFAGRKRYREVRNRGFEATVYPYPNDINTYFEARDDTNPALALCLAIEQAIDAEGQ